MKYMRWTQQHQLGMNQGEIKGKSTHKMNFYHFTSPPNYKYTVPQAIDELCTIARQVKKKRKEEKRLTRLDQINIIVEFC